MRLREWFKSGLNGDSSGEEQEKAGGQRGSRALGRMKDRWRRNAPEDRRWDDTGSSVMNQGRPFSHGLF